MKALRIVLTQNKAHYRKEESLENKMTYPLPPFSTVIGALHSACKFKDYQPMDLSIQGNYKSLSKQPYTDYCFLDSIMDDRGILVKMNNSHLYSASFEKVASSMKSQGNSFKNNITINIHNQKLMEEYWGLKKLEQEIQDFKDQRINRIMERIKRRKKTLAEKKKTADKKSTLFANLTQREQEIKELEKTIKERFDSFKREHFTKPISLYKSLTTSLKYYEILHEVKLIIHVKADEKTLTVIAENIDNLQAIGRSEDFVDVTSCEFVVLDSHVEKKKKSNYTAYLSSHLVRDEQILLKERDGVPASGTRYLINKVYNRENGYRKFEKIQVVFASEYFIDRKTKGVFYDSTGEYIVNFN